MASTTKKLKIQRKRRDRNKGMARKAKIRREGSTPPFPIHPESD